MTLTAISQQTHQGCTWQRHSDWAFARTRAIVPVSAMEIPRLCSVFPLAFIQQQEKYTPVAVMGLKPDFNLYITRDNSWLPGAIPLQLQVAPFTTAVSEHGENVLCFDDQAGNLIESPDADQPFFAADGSLAPAVAKIADTLKQHHANLARTQIASQLLAKHHLITPWEAIVDTQAQGRIKLDGLYCIDENKLNQCDANTLKELQNSGALGMAYCQLISMQHLSYLGKLADAHAKLESKHTDIQDFNLGGLLGDDDILKF